MVLDKILEDLLRTELKDEDIDKLGEVTPGLLSTLIVMNAPLKKVFSMLYDHMEEEGDNYCFTGFLFKDCELKVECRKIKK